MYNNNIEFSKDSKLVSLWFRLFFNDFQNVNKITYLCVRPFLLKKKSYLLYSGRPIKRFESVIAPPKQE